MSEPHDPRSRRDTLKLLGAAGLIAAASPLAGAQSATASSAPTAPARTNPGFYTLPVGAYRAIVLSDGQSAPGPALPNWGANPELQDQFVAALRENFLDPAQYINNFNPMLIDTGNERVLIDTGRGATQGRLLANLAAAGYAPADITTVFLTHGHGDHIGGVTTSGALTFPNARLVMGETEFNSWASQAQPNAAVQANLIALKDRFTLVGEGASIVPGVTTVPAYGHTPGHLAVHVDNGGASLLHLADAGGHYVLSFQFPGQYLGFDMDKAQAAATRARLFDQLATDRTMVVGYHFAWPGVGYVQRAGNAYRYVPAFQVL
ncbi:MBL fold metallo-hydrolase [Deinococcus maricopensis]|uniref:Beta-lactamase domain protein n=1 Tax=Deinococcus maricopensis (strain DSM 21211 / LMG 22137 / NRRL B-23946 / LB-34) TaxID=709986 RepID=E8U7Z3_DEIML|nr:MBL fold metallo-hydrolase [Deinococcus maricopensis]ADV67182.1 beta-lactamase domain protein [Deinococcus maricopensis DSM 21211]